MKVVIIRQETIRPVYSNGKLFAAFSYEIIDDVNGITDRHEKHLPLQNAEMLPMHELMQMCINVTEEYRSNLQEQYFNGAD